jgi:D-alanyl-D-alanine carboxypeptidase/D-alanyl-D-alanine-endopeptidase (penicillin-binding protein 4)
MFGPNHSFKTYLAKDGDDLWIIGTGDPGTGDPRLATARGETPVTMLENWASYLAEHGITRIAGDLVYYEGEFETDPLVHPTWPKSWLLHWYAAPTTGLSFNDNCVDITVFPTEEGQPIRYEVMPPVRDIQVINECKTVKAKGAPSIVKLKDGNIYRISGTCHEKTELKSKPVDNPGAFFADALRTQLEKKGVTVAGKIRRSETPLGGVMPPPSDKILTVYATPITDVLARVNKNSQNLFAECLCKATGQAFDAKRGRRVPGSWQSGGEAIRAFLKRSGIDDSALRPMDGSGLSPANRVSARMLSDLLAVMHSHPHAETFKASLTVAGVDGSLKDRMPEAKGMVLGKTGYIGGVSSMSGYVKTRQGQWLAVSIVYNKIVEHKDDDRDVKPFTNMQDEACRILTYWPDKAPATQPASGDAK